jgi:hypothetical protein
MIRLMKLDSYPRFEQSSYYTNMIKSIEKTDPSRLVALNFPTRGAPPQLNSFPPQTPLSSSPKKVQKLYFLLT